MEDTSASHQDDPIDPLDKDVLDEIEEYLTEDISIEDFDDAWHAELEEVLSEGLVDHTIIQNICKFRILPETCRPEVWRICLNVTSRGNALASWDGSLDLPEQDLIHETCQALSTDQEKNADLESVITFYCKSRALKFKKEYGWTDLLRPLLALPNFDKADMYNCFYALQALYVPKQPTAATHLFRLLLQYHDPELCSFLDSHKVTMDKFSELWFKALYASHCKLDVVPGLWDIYLQRADPLFMFFLALVILVNARDQVLDTMGGKTKDEIASELGDFPSALEVVDVEDFCQLAAYFSDKTPQSLHDDYQSFIFSDPLLSSSKESASAAGELAQSLCLQISFRDILHSADPHTDTEGQGDAPLVRYFLVDCRSPEKYNAGHFSTAFHIDPTLMLREPKEFATAVDTLQKAQQQAIEAGSSAGGEHICFIGSGTEEEDQYMYMVVAHLLKKHQSYVSILRGGFAGVLEYLTQEGIDLTKWITGAIDATPNSKKTSSKNQRQNHEMTMQLEGREQNTVGSFMKNLSTTLKSKSSSIKDKVTKLIEMADYEDGGHVNASSRSKPYRGTQPVFSIGDEDEQSSPAPMPPPTRPRRDSPPMEDSDVDDDDLVDLEEWLGRLNIKNPIACFAVFPGGRRHNAHLAVEGDELVCLREYRSKHRSKVISRLPLSAVNKITSKRSCPELITFRFSGMSTNAEGEDVAIEEVQRYLIPDAGQATKHIKQEIMRVLDALGDTEQSEEKST